MVILFACFVTQVELTRLVLEKVGFSMLLACVIQGCSTTGYPALRGKLFSVQKKTLNYGLFHSKLPPSRYFEESLIMGDVGSVGQN